MIIGCARRGILDIVFISKGEIRVSEVPATPHSFA